jgi:hypothetical protein
MHCVVWYSPTFQRLLTPLSASTFWSRMQQALLKRRSIAIKLAYIVNIPEDSHLHIRRCEYLKSRHLSEKSILLVDNGKLLKRSALVKNCIAEHIVHATLCSARIQRRSDISPVVCLWLGNTKHFALVQQKCRGNKTEFCTLHAVHTFILLTLWSRMKSRRNQGVKWETLYFPSVRKSIIRLEGSQAAPARPSGRNNVKVKTLW